MNLYKDTIKRLRDLAIRGHYHCEDPRYSCPKSEYGCANDASGDNCDCGADAHNAEVEKLYNEALSIVKEEV